MCAPAGCVYNLSMNQISAGGIDHSTSSLDRSDVRGLTIQGAKKALQQARLAGEPEEIYAAVVRLAQLHFRQARYAQTRLLLDEVLQNAPADSVTRCDALRMLGNCAAGLGQPYTVQAAQTASPADCAYNWHTGYINADETWCAADSPHILTASVIIAAGVIGTIQS